MAFWEDEATDPAAMETHDHMLMAAIYELLLMIPLRNQPPSFVGPIECF